MEKISVELSREEAWELVRVLSDHIPIAGFEKDMITSIKDRVESFVRPMVD